MATVINKYGKLKGWSTITFRMLGRQWDGVTEIEYNDEQKMENVYGSGKFMVGRGDGNYEAKCSFTLLDEDMQAILEALPDGTRIQDIAEFDITVSYEVGSKIMTDIVRNVKLPTAGRTVKQGDTSMSHKFETILSHIDWNQ